MKKLTLQYPCINPTLLDEKDNSKYILDGEIIYGIDNDPSTCFCFGNEENIRFKPFFEAQLNDTFDKNCSFLRWKRIL